MLRSNEVIEINRYKMGLAILGIIIAIVIGMKVYKTQIYYSDETDRCDDQISNEIELEEGKIKEILSFAVQVVDRFPIDGHAMAIIDERLIAHDQYDRYLVEIDTVAINKNEGSGFYTYYIVIQENTESELYVLPFGVEVIQDNIETLKREIVISMMKVVNGWGSSAEEFEARWIKAIGIADSERMGASYAYEKLDLEDIFQIQSIFKYMNKYLVSYQNAIRTGDATLIKGFLEGDQEYYMTQYEEITSLKKQKIRREVTHAEITDLAIVEEHEEYTVGTKLEISTYAGKRGWDTVITAEYKVGIVDDKISILDVVEVIDE